MKNKNSPKRKRSKIDRGYGLANEAEVTDHVPSPDLS